jgi:hypothetical protein
LLAEFRTFSRIRERLGYSKWMTTSTGGLWPEAVLMGMPESGRTALPLDLPTTIEAP